MNQKKAKALIKDLTKITYGADLHPSKIKEIKRGKKMQSMARAKRRNMQLEKSKQFPNLRMSKRQRRKQHILPF